VRADFAARPHHHRDLDPRPHVRPRCPWPAGRGARCRSGRFSQRFCGNSLAPRYLFTAADAAAPQRLR